MYDKVMETVNYLKKTVSLRPEIAIILGSGLGGLTDKIDIVKEIKYEDIPNFPVSTVEGHAGKLVFGTLGGKEVLAMKGRFHYYEGYSMKEITYPIYVMKLLGIADLIVSNAAGGINENFEPGTLMIIDDFINKFGDNPLIGKNDKRFGTRFPDMSEVYNKEFINLAEKTADEIKIDYKKGVYLGLTGPYYETAAEIKAYKMIGADSIGMSTVPESIVANYLGMNILGISCITNMATGISDIAHSHESVVEVAVKSGFRFCNWVEKIVENL